MTKSIYLFIGFLFTIIFCTNAVIAGEKTGPPAEKVPSSPLNGGPRNWTVRDLTTPLNLREKPSSGSKIIDRYMPGTILNNIDGCLAGSDGLIWCNVQRLEGGRRGYVALDYIKPAVGPDGTVPTGFDNSAIRAGEEKFDARGQIPCVQYSGQPMTECTYGVARSAGGYATVVIKKTDGRMRAVFFSLGKPVGTDTGEADSGDFKCSRKNNLNIISIGNERYEIPDAVVLGY